ncbi:submaxillary gland androgen-regulated protein 3A [Manihot esculenta]|uniref:Uncharacterized protein n=1 Tax=Manihot esculenta TaxID=3983 RepID=A0A2C9UFM5_MANES|nr:submaxillary gland androgen-regulated protein 3A [Manihot esculenta]OAY29221.1 hypothetical protein MANES_15G127500v8 [Manihot esculenta]
MATNLIPILSFLFFTSILSMAMSDDTCPYPCYPPPTGTGTTTTPPASQTGSLPPPGNYPTPTGNFPYYPSPPSGNNNYYGHPPPDPILPYFPFYYRKPPHQTDVSSASTIVLRSSLVVATSFTLLLGFSSIF